MMIERLKSFDRFVSFVGSLGVTFLDWGGRMNRWAMEQTSVEALLDQAENDVGVALMNTADWQLVIQALTRRSASVRDPALSLMIAALPPDAERMGTDLVSLFGYWSQSPQATKHKDFTALLERLNRVRRGHMKPREPFRTTAEVAATPAGEEPAAPGHPK